MSTRATVEVELSPRDRSLILDYGYPFDRIEAAVRAVVNSPRIELVQLDKLELRRLIGDLSISIKESDNEGLQVELDELVERLEFCESGRFSPF